MTFRKSLSTAVLALCTAVAVPAMGQTSSTNRNTQQNSQSQQAGKQVAKAQADVNKLQADLSKLRAKVRVQVLQKPEWATVVNEKKAAEATLDQARKVALNTVKNKSEYKQLQAERDAAQQVVAQFNQGGSQVTQADFDKASTAVVNNGFAMKKMEQEALKDDTKYAEANTQLEAANAKMKEVDSQVEVALKDDQEYQNASKQLEQAKTALDTAKKQLAQARQQEEQARIQQAKSRQQQGSNGGNYGR
jgi:chromosome segregation ATPase